MLLINKLFVLCFFIVAATADDQYCDSKICPPNPDDDMKPFPHVACGQDIMWDQRCSDDAEFVEITPTLQKIFLDAHNKLRNQQAMGETPGYEPATRMATMVWDEELAYLAKYNTMQCKMEHDKCHSTRLFWMSGQNLAIHGEEDDAFIAGWAPGFWFDENTLTDMDTIRSFGDVRNAEGKDIGHFTQLVKDDSYRVGCSIAKYTNENGARKSLVACNYAVANLGGRAIYLDGTTASECQSGTNPDFPALCSEDEKYEEVYIRRNF